MGFLGFAGKKIMLFGLFGKASIYAHSVNS
jgi:hypothetical protein